MIEVEGRGIVEEDLDQTSSGQGVAQLLEASMGAKGTSTTTDRAICPGSKGLFVPVLEPGQGRRDKSAGGFCPGW